MSKSATHSPHNDWPRSMFYQWPANPAQLLKVMSQSGTQSSPNDGPISMFYQCPPNPTTLHLAELCQMLLLNYNLLSMNSQYQLIVNGATTEK